MPKVPRDVSNRRVVKFLKKRGWAIHEGKSHTLATKGTITVSIPRHDVIALGTLRSILDEAGITEQEWVEL